MCIMYVYIVDKNIMVKLEMGGRGVFLINFPIQTVTFSYNVNTFVKVRQLCSFWDNLDLWI
jgi:hypothetical protein